MCCMCLSVMLLIVLSIRYAKHVSAEEPTKDSPMGMDFFLYVLGAMAMFVGGFAYNEWNDKPIPSNYKTV